MWLSPIGIVSRGGYYWPHIRHSSPGHSIAIEHDTRFDVPLEGPKSRVVVLGTLRDMDFILDDGRKFRSPNELVNTVRDPSSNAWLYLHLWIDGRRVSADYWRNVEASRLIQAEADALETFAQREDFLGQSYEERIWRAANYLSNEPECIEWFRR